ncbi:uncharacterized protein LOC143375207 isoform X2 [Andrena cerasifolii]|uniref:uncharacterized protein LOC143375207 isoform X2 n=1 Tax=Andrena cerasifolii TaxID=2819439 RepID=UPI004037605A
MLPFVGITIPILCLFMEFGSGYRGFLELEREDDRCDGIMNEIVSDDRTIATDDTPTRLHSTWLSQECEVRAGPEHIIRKYSFFENGTFHLLRYHYAEESCSIATYTVVARGSIEISSASATIPGATEARVQIDSVHLIPLNRQVAHKFRHRINASCGVAMGGKWRPYVAQLIYERPIDVPSSTGFQAPGLNFNSFKSRLPHRLRRPIALDCLESVGIEFHELRLFRVERKGLVSAANATLRDPIGRGADKPRATVELLLGGLARNDGPERSGRRRPNRLQSAALLRADTAARCPICRSVFRGTEYSPPLFHQTPPLPAVIGGLWLSIRCESVDGGLWSRRFYRIYSSSGQWSARWTYYADSTCSILFYTVTAAGTYVQRAVNQKPDPTNSMWRFGDGIRNDHHSNETTPFNRAEIPLRRASPTLYGTKSKGVAAGLVSPIALPANRPETTDNSQLQLNNRVTLSLVREDVDVAVTVAALPSGTTELELRVIHSHLIPDDKLMSSRCKPATIRLSQANSIQTPWSRNCTLRTLEAPAILRFKAKISLDWNGDYTLLLAPWNDHFWEAPLRRCSATALASYFVGTSNKLAESLLGSTRFYRRGRYWSSLSSASCLSTSSSTLLLGGIFSLYPVLLLALDRSSSYKLSA